MRNQLKLNNWHLNSYLNKNYRSKWKKKATLKNQISQKLSQKENFWEKAQFIELIPLIILIILRDQSLNISTILIISLNLSSHKFYKFKNSSSPHNNKYNKTLLEFWVALKEVKLNTIRATKNQTKSSQNNKIIYKRTLIIKKKKRFKLTNKRNKLKKSTLPLILLNQGKVFPNKI